MVRAEARRRKDVRSRQRSFLFHRRVFLTAEMMKEFEASRDTFAPPRDPVFSAFYRAAASPHCGHRID
nr:hypothetical protein [Novosphingobium panipatense]